MQICIHNRFSIHGKSLRSQEGRFLGMPQGARLCRGCWKIADDLSHYPHHLLINKKAEQQKLLNNKWSKITFYPLLKDKALFFTTYYYIDTTTIRTYVIVNVAVSALYMLRSCHMALPTTYWTCFFHWKSNKNNWNKDTDIVVYSILYSTANWNGTPWGHQSS